MNKSSLTMISVIIPLYNKSNTILSTLDTVLKQTYRHFEILIINDGCTDNSVELIQNSITDERIKIIHQKNQGVSVARNKGVECAKYEYIAFLDGDDEWLPEYLSKMVDAIQLFPDSKMFCSAGLGRNGEGPTVKRQIDKYSNKVVAFNFFENPHIFLHISATVVTKELFYEVNGFPIGMKRNEDFAFLYSAALFTQPIYSGFPLSIYVGGVENQATTLSIYENENLLSDIVKRYNIVQENWIKSKSNNASFLIFMRYELRHFLMINSINKEFATNLYILNHLKPDILEQFSFLEKFLISHKSLYRLSIFFTLITKVFWRMRGFQRVKTGV